jgi:hypothetical protein
MLTNYGYALENGEMTSQWKTIDLMLNENIKNVISVYNFSCQIFVIAFSRVRGTAADVLEIQRHQDG